MNIFVLDKNPEKAAEYHCDKHIVKMIVEYAQLLSTAHRVLDGEDYYWREQLTNEGMLDDFDMQVRLYKITHRNHPSNIWTRSSKKNYQWLFRLFLACLKEYSKRYDKIHKTSRLVEYLRKPPKKIPKGKLTAPPKMMPDECKVNGVVNSYRLYYIKYKYKFAKWKYSPKPEWYERMR